MVNVKFIMKIKCINNKYRGKVTIKLRFSYVMTYDLTQPFALKS